MEVFKNQLNHLIMCEGVALVLNIIFETQFNIYQFILKYLVKYFKYKAKWEEKSILFAVWPFLHLDANIYVLAFEF